VAVVDNDESIEEDEVDDEDEEMVEEEQVNGLNAHTPEGSGINPTANPLLQHTSSGAARDEDEDLYTVTPPSEQVISAKRPAGELSPRDETSAKRLRGSEVAETLVPEGDLLPVPVAIPAVEERENREVVEQKPQHNAPSQQSAAQLDDGDSDSDFEIPPLTFAPEMDLQDEDGE
jgi:hypothetical protein